MNAHNMSVWIPSANSVDVKRAHITTNWIRTSNGADIAVPVLSETGDIGELLRIDSFRKGKETILGFYEHLTSPNYERLTGEERIGTDNESESLRLAEMADGFANRCVQHARTISRNRTIRRQSATNYRRTSLVRNVDVTSTNIYIGLASELVGRLEDALAGELIPQNEASVAIKRNTRQAAILLIRGTSESKVQQVCLFFGERKWRRRRSMYLDCVRITLPIGARIKTPFESVSCTCATHRLGTTCEHSESITSDIQNTMRFSSLFLDGPNSNMVTAYQEGTWSAVRIPSISADNVIIWHVFRRSDLSSRFRTSCPVLYDIRPQSIHRRLEMRVQCMLCLGSASNRNLCVHESTAIERIRHDEQSQPSDAANRFIPPDMGLASDEEEAYRMLDEIIGIEDDGNGSERDESRPVSYISSAKRSFFPCISEDEAINRVMLEVFANRERPNGISFVGIDNESICKNCAEQVCVPDLSATIPRRAMLHTLHHGTVAVQAMDYRCPQCGYYNHYDGLSDGLFNVSKDHIFTRELLDSWLWDVCNTGGTFRDAFASWETKLWMPTAKLHRCGKEPNISRQLGNEAFAAFLLTLRFPNEEDMNALFSCTTCEKTLASGEKRLDGVVMDGSAVGTSTS